MQRLRYSYKIIHSSFKFFVKRNWFMIVNGTRYRTIENPNGRHSFNNSRIAAGSRLQEVLVFHSQRPLEFFQLKGLLMNCYFTKINENSSRREQSHCQWTDLSLLQLEKCGRVALFTYFCKTIQTPNKSLQVKQFHVSRKLSLAFSFLHNSFPHLKSRLTCIYY